MAWLSSNSRAEQQQATSQEIAGEDECQWLMILRVTMETTYARVPLITINQTVS